MFIATYSTPESRRVAVVIMPSTALPPPPPTPITLMRTGDRRVSSPCADECTSLDDEGEPDPHEVLDEGGPRIDRRHVRLVYEEGDLIVFMDMRRARSCACMFSKVRASVCRVAYLFSKGLNSAPSSEIVLQVWNCTVQVMISTAVSTLKLQLVQWTDR